MILHALFYQKTMPPVKTCINEKSPEHSGLFSLEDVCSAADIRRSRPAVTPGGAPPCLMLSIKERYQKNQKEVNTHLPLIFSISIVYSSRDVISPLSSP